MQFFNLPSALELFYDCPRKLNSMATKCKDDETPLFSWIEWPDRETADKAFADMMNGPAMQNMPEIPFDGKRMFWSGFASVVDEN